MYKLGGRRKLGRKASHRKALINNQVRSLLISGKVETTTQKAKVLKANADSFLTTQSAAKDEVATRALLDAMSVKGEEATKVLEYLKADPKVTIVKVGFRDGDNAELSKVRLIGFNKEDKKDKKKSKNTKKESTNKEVEDSTSADSQPSDKDSKGPGKSDEKSGNLGKSLRSKLGRKERARSRSGI